MAELSANEKLLIADLHKRWILVELSGDSSKLIEYCTDNVIWMPPHASPLLGKETIARYLNETRAHIKDVKISNLTIRGNDNVAYLTSDYSSHFVPRGQTSTQEANGSHLWVLEKHVQVWLVAVVAWSLASLRIVGDEAAKTAAQT
jgi:ketosteroid isomerase-like protein